MQVPLPLTYNANNYTLKGEGMDVDELIKDILMGAKLREVRVGLETLEKHCIEMGYSTALCATYERSKQQAQLWRQIRELKKTVSID